MQFLDRICLENANLSHNYGLLELSTFQPVQKNPPISKVFREIGLADELGSGMRNTYKYTRLYSGAEPQFVEGDIFKTIIPLTEAATATVGPVVSLQGTEATEQVTGQVTGQVDLQLAKEEKLIDFCSIPRSRKEMQEFLHLAGRNNFNDNYLKPLLATGRLKMTIPDKPNSPKQKYIRT